MNTKLIGMLGATLFGSFGGWIGFKVGLMTGFFASMVGTGVGYYVAWRFVRDYLE